MPALGLLILQTQSAVRTLREYSSESFLILVGNHLVSSSPPWISTGREFLDSIDLGATTVWVDEALHAAIRAEFVSAKGAV